MKIVGTHLQRLEWSGGTLRVSLRLLVRDWNPKADVEFFLRSRRALAIQRATSVTLTPPPSHDANIADVDAHIEIHGASVPDGIWDGWVKVEGGEIGSDQRVETRCEGTDYPVFWGVESGLREVRPYDTADRQLSVLVGRRRLGGVDLTRVDWDSDKLVVTGRVHDSLDAAIVGARAASEGQSFDVPVISDSEGTVHMEVRVGAYEAVAAWQLLWELADSQGHRCHLPVGLDEQSARPSSAWLLPTQRVTTPGPLWYGAAFDHAGELRVESVPPVEASFTKVLARHLPGLSARVDLVLSVEPLGMLERDAVRLDEIDDARLVSVDTKNPGGDPKTLKSIVPLFRQRLQLEFATIGKNAPETDSTVCLQYRVGGRSYLVPVAITSPAAYRRFPGFKETAVPAFSTDRCWHAIVADVRSKSLRYVRRRKTSSEKPETRIKDRLAAAAASVARKSDFHETWLVGENLGNVAQDNGVVFFEHCLQHKRPEKVLFVARTNNRHMRRLEPNKEFVVRYNSFSHYYHYHLADRLVVAHGIRDVMPSLHHSHVSENEKSVVYLQHGIIAMKKVGYSNGSYNGHIDAFVVSSEGERDIMVKYNGMSSDRIVVTGLPRYDNLISKESSRAILVMPTWRDWNMGSREDFCRSDFLRNYRALLTNERLLSVLRSEGRKIRFFPHFEIESRFRNELDFESDRVEICSYANADIQEEIRTCDALVTDYSSVAWDVNYLRKPVYFFQFDKDEYELLRGSYVDLKSELPGCSVATSEEVVACLLDGIESAFAYDDASEQVSRKYYGFRDRENTERVYRAIRRLRNRDAQR